MRTVSSLFSFALLFLACPAFAQSVESSWGQTKKAAAREIYVDNHKTLYCGCTYEAHATGSGGSVDLTACNMQRLDKYKQRAKRIEWEHIVPASLMPARHFSCWTNPEQFQMCVSDAGSVSKGRDCCERVNLQARKMIFDLHNLAPAIGQVNAYRLNDRYGVVDDDSPHEQWPGCDAQHFRAQKPRDHRFEPADCTKGDVARVWFYMHDQHGVVIPDAEWNMFVDWSDGDPISSWEIERDRRIEAAQGNNNPYVTGHAPDPAGACSWDPQ